MDEVRGEVGLVEVTPGRRDLLRVKFIPEGQGCFLSPDEPDSHVSFNGKKVDAVGLLVCLLDTRGRVDAVLHPLFQRYGLSLVAEFTTGAGG